MIEAFRFIIEKIMEKPSLLKGKSSYDKKQLSKVEKNIEMLKIKQNHLLDLYMEKDITYHEYEELTKDCNIHMNNILKEKELILSGIISDDKVEKYRKELKSKIIAYTNDVSNFDKNLFNKLIEFMIIGGKNNQKASDPLLIRFMYKPESIIEYKIDKHIDDITKKLNDKEYSYVPVLDVRMPIQYHYLKRTESTKKWVPVGNVRIRLEMIMEN